MAERFGGGIALVHGAGLAGLLADPPAPGAGAGPAGPYASPAQTAP
ncbi:hypothetical protein [Streptomyces synnematoformans]